ncbi:MAG: hypothetical protein HOL01_18740 [Planctomycetaceae bacterium]|jgi:hypothetical protein|nr:hypothetical protein [Planctomycetaceae bacterium]MBT6487777.1 hypothetical protein [Planctomycetaceae bacterium]MBT6496576.1 hypothetical protein [Planctomycetaceae bacterium]
MPHPTRKAIARFAKWMAILIAVVLVIGLVIYTFSSQGRNGDDEHFHYHRKTESPDSDAR